MTPPFRWPDEAEEEDRGGRRCPYCAGPAGELGRLGRRAHYLCRDCGLHFSGSAGRGP